MWQRLVVRDYPHAIVEAVQDWKEEWVNLRKNKFNPERTHSWLQLSEDKTQGITSSALAKINRFSVQFEGKAAAWRLSMVAKRDINPFDGRLHYCKFKLEKSMHGNWMVGVADSSLNVETLSTVIQLSLLHFFFLFLFLSLSRSHFVLLSLINNPNSSSSRRMGMYSRARMDDSWQFTKSGLGQELCD